jgi:predicted nucleic acid-binding protein
MSYWDTSCLAKLYAREADSARFRSYLASGATVVTSEIARMELWVALRRKEAAGDIVSAREALRAYDRHVAEGRIAVETIDRGVATEFESIIEKCYGQMVAVPLRTLDAIHLASATLSGEAEIVATDRRLRAAASLLGFRLYPPA